jgi:hypothetical protein
MCVFREVRTSSTYKKVKLSPQQATEADRVVRTSRIPHILDNKLIDGGQVLRLTRPLCLTSKKIPPTHLYERLSKLQVHGVAGSFLRSVSRLLVTANVFLFHRFLSP